MLGVFFTHWRSLNGCVVIPLCHFQSFLAVLALCSHFPYFSGIWLLISFPQRQGYHHTEVVYLLCTQTASTTSFRFTSRCLSVHASSKPELDPAKLLLSTPHTLVWLPTFSDRPLWLVFRSISFTICGQTALMSTVSCPSDIKVCHGGHSMPESGPAHNSSCRSSHLPPRLNLENLLSPSLLLLPCPSSHHISSRPSQRGHRGQLILPPLIIICFQPVPSLLLQPPFVSST